MWTALALWLINVGGLIAYLWIASRAIDETGYVQPSREALIAARGTNSVYHYNGIKFWHVRGDGTVTNVEG